MYCPAPGRTAWEVGSRFLSGFMWMYQRTRGVRPTGDHLLRLCALAAMPWFEMGRGPYICCNPAGVWRGSHPACADNPREPLREFVSVSEAAQVMYNMIWSAAYTSAWRNGVTGWDRVASLRTYWRRGYIPRSGGRPAVYEPEYLRLTAELYQAAEVAT